MLFILIGILFNLMQFDYCNSRLSRYLFFYFFTFNCSILMSKNTQNKKKKCYRQTAIEEIDNDF